MNGADLQFISATLRNEKLTRYCNLASLAVLVYDHILTFGLEVKLVWPAPWSTAKFLFFATRYVVFTDVILNLYFHLAPASISPEVCTIAYLVSGSLIMLGILIAELTLLFRTLVIWGHDRKIAIILFGTVFFLCIPTSILGYLGWRTVKYDTSPIPQLVSCWMATQTGDVLFAGYVIICVFESVIFVLTVYKGLEHFRLSKSNLAIVLYRDGLIYYGYLVGFSLLNIIFLLLKPGGSLILMQRVWHSILTARMLVNLRDAASKDLAKWAPTSTRQRSAWSLPEPLRDDLESRVANREV